MTLQRVNTGTPPSGTDGDTVRTAMDKVNAVIDSLNSQNPMQKTGGTFTGPVSFTNPGSAVAPSLDGPSGSYRYHNYLTSGVVRWANGVSNAPENSNNTGADWFLARYSDTGAYLDTPFTINRTSGAASFSQRPSWGGAIPWDNGNLPKPAQTTGGTYTGELVVKAATGISRMMVDGGINQDRYYGWAQDGVPRWILDCIPNTNGLYLNRYNAVGANLDTPLYVDYSTGNIYVTNQLSLGGGSTKLRMGVGGYGGNAYGSVWQTNASGTTSWPMVFFNAAGAVVGSIGTTDAATSFTTTSDYRLKTDLRPIAGPLASVNRMKFYDGVYKVDPGNRVDFVLAHELQEEAPFAVIGEKDAMGDWHPVFRAGYDPTDVQPGDVTDTVQDILPQAVDYSKLVPRLGAAIQELSSLLSDALSRISELEARP